MKNRLIKIINFGMLLISISMTAHAESKKKGEDVKDLSGISIVGNKEAPKSLYIVPWKNSEIDLETSLNSGLLDEGMKPVDKEVFMRELDFYEFSHAK